MFRPCHTVFYDGRVVGHMTEGHTPNKHLVCIPYISGLSEQLQRVFKFHGIPSYHKPFNTIRSLFVSPKDKSKKEKQCGVIYTVTCSECDQEYIAETTRMLGTRFQEHTDGKHPNSTIAEHTSFSDHHYTLDDTKATRPPHPTPTLVMWPSGHVTSHSTIIKDCATWLNWNVWVCFKFVSEW